MNTKQKKKNAGSRSKRQTPKAPKSKPFSSVGEHLGGFVGMPGVGREIGGFIGRILGSGDYTTNFEGVKNNALLADHSVPSFGTYESTIITHREYLGDVVSSATALAFGVTTYPINPGLTSSFPWLCDIASNYEEYELLGLVYEYKTMSGNNVANAGSNTSLGSVIMATEYDPTKPAFSSKLAMENYFFAQSVVPSCSIMHAVECKSELTPVKRLYIRTGSPTGPDLRWSDYGNFSIATVGVPGASVTLGELWCTYKVKLHKPRLPITIGSGGQIAGYHASRGLPTLSFPFGTVGFFIRNTLTVTPTISGNVFTFVPEPNGIYLFNYNFAGAALVTAATSAVVSGGGSALLYFRNSLATFMTSSTSTDSSYIIAIQANAIPAPINITLSTSFTAPASYADVVLTQVDNTL